MVALLVDLINTRYPPLKYEVLAGEGATLWLRTHGAICQNVAREASLARLRRVREGLRQMALANNQVVGDSQVLRDGLEALQTNRLRLRFDAGSGEAVLVPAGTAGAAEEVVAAVATALMRGQADTSWARVKACAAPSCGYAYLDSSRNSSRRWCTMSRCGGRAKSQAWRERQTAPSRKQVR